MIDTVSLRKKIIELALQGALTPEVEKKEVDALIESINKQRTEFLRKGIVKKWKVLSDIKKDELLFDIPMNWTVKRLGEICLPMSDGIHYAPPYLEVGYPCFSAKDIYDDKIHLENCTYISDEEYFGMKEKINVNEGCLLITKSGSIGRSAIVEKYYEFGLVESIGVINPIVVKSAYLKAVLDYGFVYSNRFAEKYTRGVGLKHLTLTLLENIPIPIPCLEIQEMIIEKIHDVFKVLDTIDELQKSYLSDVDVLKNNLIDASIQGKLTEQLPEDGTAEELLVQIAEEKKQLIKEKKIKATKALPEITEDEIPFEIPDNWKWTRLNDIGLWSAGATPSRRNMSYYSGCIPWVKTGELNNGVLKQTEEHISELALKECSVRLNPIGSVLIAMYGATIGKVSILDIEATTNQACCACIPYMGVHNKYLFYYLISHKEDFISKSHGGAQPNISKDIIINELIPLPPYEEQTRIADKLEELLGLI